MTRVKGGVKRRRKHKKILKLAKGYWMSRHKQYKKAKEAILHAGEYAFAGRRLKKRQFRRLWIMRINAALQKHEIKYSRFIRILKVNNIDLDRKVLSQIAIEKPRIFEKIVNACHSEKKP